MTSRLAANAPAILTVVRMCQLEQLTSRDICVPARGDLDVHNHSSMFYLPSLFGRVPTS